MPTQSVSSTAVLRLITVTVTEPEAASYGAEMMLATTTSEASRGWISNEPNAKRTTPVSDASVAP